MEPAAIGSIGHGKSFCQFPTEATCSAPPSPLLKPHHVNPIYPWRWGSSGLALGMSPGKAVFISLHPTQLNCWLSTVHGDDVWQTLSSTQALSTLFLMVSFCFEQQGSVSGPCWWCVPQCPLQCLSGGPCQAVAFSWLVEVIFVAVNSL